MACNCGGVCACVLSGANGLTVTGSGNAGDPYVITPPSETAFTAANTDGGLFIAPGGTNGHAPVINLRIDPTGTAPVSVSPSGLKVDCCNLGGTSLVVINTPASTLLLDIDQVVLVDASGGPVVVSLPASHTAGRQIHIKDANNSAANISIDSDDGDLIDGALTDTFNTNGESAMYVSDGVDWWRL